MRTILICLIMVIAKSHGQPAPANDTAKSKAIVMPPDSVAIISMALLDEFFYKLGDRIQMPDKSIYQLTPNERDKINYLFRLWVIEPAIIEWNKKKKPK